MEAADVMADMIDAAADAASAYIDMADAISQAVSELRELAQAQANYAASEATSSGEQGYDPDTDYTGFIETGLINGYLKQGDSTYEDVVAQQAKKMNTTTEALDEYYSKTSATNQSKWTAGQYNSEQEWLKKRNEIASLATGGYTGEFDDGRLAFLHEKELVLNADDTANILTAVSAIRDFGPEFFGSIEKALDSNVLAAMGLVGERLSTTEVGSPQETLEQDVHIEAVFPNVTSSSEIEEALSNLVNDASQYARRRS